MRIRMPDGRECYNIAADGGAITWGQMRPEQVTDPSLSWFASRHFGDHSVTELDVCASDAMRIALTLQRRWPELRTPALPSAAIARNAGPAATDPTLGTAARR
jgi:hypothetical protein